MINLSSPDSFWKTRLEQAIASAEAAPSERSRMAYVELARHYRSMHELITTHENRCDTRRDAMMWAA
ncbi:MAG TPA: hypothetical protein VFP53_01225 [Sphingomicrobium sp.]|nr:hypothetical protein [Sphingomicrobium sp.]